jgi:maltooligosyltrehalose trehalohydrolase
MAQRTPPRRNIPIGAEVQRDGSVHFRVWAPHAKIIEVVIEGNEESVRPSRAAHTSRGLKREPGGYHSGIVAGARVGTLYRYRVDRKNSLLPDPASRFQPDGPHGPSEVVDPSTFRWSDRRWKGVAATGQVLYELHVGTFTQEGTWIAAAEHLHELATIGITVVEIMPVADFPGRFGWGYDGVCMFAPTRLYGVPDDFRAFVDRAHAEKIAVILDVVFNHLGPDGNYLREFAPEYFSQRYKTEWGEAINFDGKSSGPVREFYLSCARYWIQEFHLDGLRIDATQAFFDASDDHILRCIVRDARKAARGRSVIIVGESEPQRAELMRPIENGGFGMDMLWNDDFHHSAIVAITGRTEAYFTDYRGTPQELLSSVKWGYLFQGQFYKWQDKGRGSNAWGVPRYRFVNYLQNHDQLPNAGIGRRLHTLVGPSRLRAMTALFLLGPGTPLIFQGEEFGASTPFHYFADHQGELAKFVFQGRKKFLSQFRSAATPEIQARIPDPRDPHTFESSKLKSGDRLNSSEVFHLYRDLLRLRHHDDVLKGASEGVLDGAVLGDETLVIRFFSEKKDDRLLIVNLGRALHLDLVSEPLLAPFDAKTWTLFWSSEDPCYGGQGTPSLIVDEGWEIPGHAAILLKPGEKGERHG